MAISANLGQDTDHNSTKLVCDHPLKNGEIAAQEWRNRTLVDHERFDV